MRSSTFPCSGLISTVQDAAPTAASMKHGSGEAASGSEQTMYLPTVIGSNRNSPILFVVVARCDGRAAFRAQPNDHHSSVSGGFSIASNDDPADRSATLFLHEAAFRVSFQQIAG